MQFSRGELTSFWKDSCANAWDEIYALTLVGRLLIVIRVNRAQERLSNNL